MIRALGKRLVASGLDLPRNLVHKYLPVLWTRVGPAAGPLPRPNIILMERMRALGYGR